MEAPREQVDIDRLKEQYPPSAVAERYGLELKRAGSRIVACCPFHDDPSPSFTVYEDHFYCYGCQWSGDVLDFVAGMEGGLEFKEAAKALQGQTPASSTPTRQFVPRDTRPKLTPVIPVPVNAPSIQDGQTTPPIFNPNKGEAKAWRAPAAIYRYYNGRNKFIGAVLRAEIQGSKITPQVMWCEWEGGTGWALQTFPVPRPLYRPPAHPVPAGGSKRSDQPNRTVLVVEGEKAAVAAARKLSALYEVVTWPGGGHGVHLADWKPLKGRQVLLWPDADEQGYQAMGKLGAILEQLNDGPELIRFVLTMDEPAPPKGWDLADEPAWKQDDVLRWGKPRARAWGEHGTLLQLGDEKPAPIESKAQARRRQRKEKGGASPKAPPVPDAGSPPLKPDDIVEAIRDNPHFQVLGYQGDKRFFFPYGKDRTQQVVELTPGKLGKRDELVVLADIDWWREMFPSGEKSISWINASQALHKACVRAGIYDPLSERGRGAWLDAGRPVFHSGDQVWMDGKVYQPGRVPSKYKYPKDLDMEVSLGKPLTDEQAQQTSRMIQQLSWEREASGLMLVGWTVLAPVCGMLKWRPHVWITGASGSGKTTALNLVERILGNMPIRAENITSEAGLRQRLKRDARPVLFDEAEAEDQRSATRLRQVLDLVRVSSSGGKVTKGTSGGTPMEFLIRACFCLSAINPSAVHWADTSRISKLVLIHEGAGASSFYEQFVKQVSEIFTPAYAAGMLARTVQHMPVLRQNITTVSDAATAVLQSSRVGDQVGSLLAGALFCESTVPVTYEAAEALCKRLDFSEIREVAADTDQQRLLQRILGERAPVQSNRGMVSLTFGEMAEMVMTWRVLEGVEPRSAELELKRFGIRVDKEHSYLVIANQNDGLAKKLADTPWSKDWKRALCDLEGASKSGKALDFAGGVKQRGTNIPHQHWLTRRPRDEWALEGESENGDGGYTGD